MENTTVMDVVLDKKMDGYGWESKDYLAHQELTVTITLGEYRKLVQDCATAQSRISAAEDDKYKRNAENENLRNENASLKAELYELQKKLDIEKEISEDTEL